VNLLFESQKENSPVVALVFPEVKTTAAAIKHDVASQDSASLLEAKTDVRLVEAKQAEELVRAREEGRLEGLAEGEQRRKEDLEIERSAVSHLCTGFAKERKRYFAEVEAEVVKLALAIAARVLQRESAMDPTLLKGVVKVALSKLGDVKGAVLKMHPEDVNAWHVAMKHSGLEIAGDASMERGELRLEAAGGVAELGVAAQLVEVERGFFDLMARRPA
jgi:flagellar assembly protein FliH